MTDLSAPQGSAESPATQNVPPQGEDKSGQSPAAGDNGQQPERQGEAALDAPEKRQQPKKTGSRRDARIDRLTRELNAYKDQATFYRGEAERLSKEKLKPLDPVKHPTDDDWGTAIAENAALKSQQGFAKSQADINAERAEQIETEIWKERSETYKQIVPDFDEVVYGVKTEVPAHVLQLIRSMENGPPAAYYLAKNVKELTRISRMNPMEAAFELGRLDRQLTATTPKVVSKTPAPPQTVHGRSAGNQTPVDKMTPAQYSAWKASKSLPK